MTLAAEFRQYYESRHGRRTARSLAFAIAPLVRQEPHVRLLALGYPRPLLTGLRPDRFERVAMLTTEGAPVQYWPRHAERNCAAAGHADDLPFSGAMFDQILVVHTLEHGDARAILAEVGRVLAPAGDLILIVPNRAGLWTHFESTPFGRGHPYGRGELTRLLADGGFAPETWRTVLSAPPLRGFRWLERPLAALLPRMGGVHCVLARKQGGPAAAAISAQPVRARRPALAPTSPVGARAMSSRRPPGSPLR
ncbi:hypothetical protein B5C34_03265 [Pacificimonas flava]|uniref:Methyltransferase type 11 domain-containing protein n=2 Tax=Pacificimonas TaxID=1960290 RepID=A0A219B353_9SPHN|nr:MULTISPECIES: class I SAM-dependent methyltransferase [Pacificimonas]MBZ6377761.1 class I SAM-dependent methyltransferase [Pacificimonas aurantium]OWV32563.1 hypothetical protein B5C34_03265 [Pacificimonas flava]